MNEYQYFFTPPPPAPPPLPQDAEMIDPKNPFDNETELIDGGVLESMDIVAIVGEIKEAFDVNIGIEQLTPENFNSEEAILELIEQLMEEE